LVVAAKGHTEAVIIGGTQAVSAFDVKKLNDNTVQLHYEVKK
jgi:hypothetical protein